MRAYTACELLRDGLEKADQRLPERLLKHPLFVSQKVTPSPTPNTPNPDSTQRNPICSAYNELS